MRRPFVDRLLDGFTVGDGCWEWQASTNGYGYGKIVRHGRNVYAHRAMYELFVGDIPKGKVLDHVVCDNPPCVRPSHLEAKTNRENIMRGKGACAQFARRKFCKRGHDVQLEVNRYYYPNGTWKCRPCQTENMRLWISRKPYRARLRLNGKLLTVGHYLTREEAQAASAKALRGIQRMERILGVGAISR